MAENDRFSEVEWLAKTADVGVRINTLAPGKSTPWHYHRVVTDNVFGLDSPVEVALREPVETVRLLPGQRLEIAAGRVHRVSNPSDRPLRYLLVQATGPYDFNVVPDAAIA
jgi:quercetin dioxygenase-like cupin family protein